MGWFETLHSSRWQICNASGRGAVGDHSGGSEKSKRIKNIHCYSHWHTQDVLLEASARGRHTWKRGKGTQRKFHQRNKVITKRQQKAMFSTVRVAEPSIVSCALMNGVAVALRKSKIDVCIHFQVNGGGGHCGGNF